MTDCQNCEKTLRSIFMSCHVTDTTSACQNLFSELNKIEFHFLHGRY